MTNSIKPKNFLARGPKLAKDISSREDTLETSKKPEALIEPHQKASRSNRATEPQEAVEEVKKTRSNFLQSSPTVSKVERKTSNELDKFLESKKDKNLEKPQKENPAESLGVFELKKMPLREQQITKNKDLEVKIGEDNEEKNRTKEPKKKLKPIAKTAKTNLNPKLARLNQRNPEDIIKALMATQTGNISGMKDSLKPSAGPKMPKAALQESSLGANIKEKNPIKEQVQEYEKRPFQGNSSLTISSKAEVDKEMTLKQTDNTESLKSKRQLDKEFKKINPIEALQNTSLVNKKPKIAPSTTPKVVKQAPDKGVSR
ncbi:MAG: hypothetical protein K0Q51_205 [Rickettsiaceae bacterium]|jgi:hypothetical protein|nr:hypothetical protein [Rickettsiaceae bacterium]